MLISINATNVGSGSLVLNSVGFLLKDKSKIVLLNPYLIRLPCKLEERRKISALLPCRTGFREAERRDEIIGVFFQDETGKEWASKISKKERKLWLEPINDGLKIIWHPDLMSWSVEDE